MQMVDRCDVLRSVTLCLAFPTVLTLDKQTQPSRRLSRSKLAISALRHPAMSITRLVLPINTTE